MDLWMRMRKETYVGAAVSGDNYAPYIYYRIIMCRCRCRCRLLVRAWFLFWSVFLEGDHGNSSVYLLGRWPVISIITGPTIFKAPSVKLATPCKSLATVYFSLILTPNKAVDRLIINIRTCQLASVLTHLVQYSWYISCSLAYLPITCKLKFSLCNSIFISDGSNFILWCSGSAFLLLSISTVSIKLSKNKNTTSIQDSAKNRRTKKQVSLSRMECIDFISCKPFLFVTIYQNGIHKCPLLNFVW